MTDDLFASARDERLHERAPFAARLRPRTLDEVVGQEHLLGAGRPLRVLIEGDRLSSVVLWGPPGTGKTTIARLIAGVTAKAFEPLSAVSAGVKDVREVVDRARDRLGEHGQGTILFLDEVHRFNKTQQDALLPHVEEGLIVLIGATTENPYFSLTGPLLSRSTLFRLDPLEPDVRTLLEHALTDGERGLGEADLSVDTDALDHLIDRSEGDARHALTSLEVAGALAAEDGPINKVTLADAEAALALRRGPVRRRRALRRPVRVHQEHPRLRSRRRAVLARPHAGSGRGPASRRPSARDPRVRGHRHGRPAVPAGRRRRRPRRRVRRHARGSQPRPGRHPPHARAPSRTCHRRHRRRDRGTSAIGPPGAVPVHLRDASTLGPASSATGGYVYPHDRPPGWVPQQYRPADVEARVYYQPGTQHEAELGELLERRRTRRDAEGEHAVDGDDRDDVGDPSEGA